MLSISLVLLLAFFPPSSLSFHSTLCCCGCPLPCPVQHREECGADPTASCKDLKSFNRSEKIVACSAVISIWISNGFPITEKKTRPTTPPPANTGQQHVLMEMQSGGDVTLVTLANNDAPVERRGPSSGTTYQTQVPASSSSDDSILTSSSHDDQAVVPFHSSSAFSFAGEQPHGGGAALNFQSTQNLAPSQFSASQNLAPSQFSAIQNLAPSQFSAIQNLALSQFSASQNLASSQDLQKIIGYSWRYGDDQQWRLVPVTLADAQLLAIRRLQSEGGGNGGVAASSVPFAPDSFPQQPQLQQQQLPQMQPQIPPYPAAGYPHPSLMPQIAPPHPPAPPPTESLPHAAWRRFNLAVEGFTSGFTSLADRFVKLFA